LHHEEWSLAVGHLVARATAGFGRAAKVSFGLVFFEAHWIPVHGARNLFREDFGKPNHAG
jgi:hypothetical protein